MSNLVYAWTGDKSVSDKATAHFLEYINKNQAFMVVIEDFIFDSLSLRDKVVLSRCIKCLNFQNKNCCSGNSYTMSKENAEILKSVAREVLEVIPNNTYVLDSYNTYGALTKNNSTTTRGNKDGNCIFSYSDLEGYKCAINKWCIDNKKDASIYKPYLCSLFPLQGIKMPNGKIVVFKDNKDTRMFSMYFYTLSRRVCVDEENMLKVCSGEVGNSSYLKSINSKYLIENKLLEDMRPVYLEQEKILRHLCGDNIYERLVEKLG